MSSSYDYLTDLYDIDSSKKSKFGVEESILADVGLSLDSTYLKDKDISPLDIAQTALDQLDYDSALVEQEPLYQESNPNTSTETFNSGKKLVGQDTGTMGFFMNALGRFSNRNLGTNFDTTAVVDGVERNTQDPEGKLTKDINDLSINDLRSSFDALEEDPTAKQTLYYLRVDHKDGTASYKVGLAKNGAVQRYEDQYFANGDKITVLYDKRIKDAAAYEALSHGNRSLLKYRRYEKGYDDGFGAGKTEIYNYDFLGLDGSQSQRKLNKLNTSMRDKYLKQGIELPQWRYDQEKVVGFQKAIEKATKLYGKDSKQVIEMTADLDRLTERKGNFVGQAYDDLGNSFDAFQSGAGQALIGIADLALDTLAFDGDGNNRWLDKYKSAEFQDKFWKYDSRESEFKMNKATHDFEQGDYTSALYTSLTNPAIMAQSLPEMGLMFVPFVGVGGKVGKAFAKLKGLKGVALKKAQLDVAAEVGYGASVAYGLARSGGFLSVAAKMTNNNIDERIKNNGGKPTSMAENLAIFATVTPLLYIDKLAVGATMAAPLRKALGKTLEVAGKEGVSEVAKSVLKKLAIISLDATAAMSEEGIQEYMQQWGDILSQQLGTEKYGDNVWTEENFRNALTAGIAGAGAGGQIHIAVNSKDALLNKDRKIDYSQLSQQELDFTKNANELEIKGYSKELTDLAKVFVGLQAKIGATTDPVEITEINSEVEKVTTRMALTQLKMTQSELQLKVVTDLKSKVKSEPIDVVGKFENADQLRTTLFKKAQEAIKDKSKPKVVANEGIIKQVSSLISKLQDDKVTVDEATLKADPLLETFASTLNLVPKTLIKELAAGTLVDTLTNLKTDLEAGTTPEEKVVVEEPTVKIEESISIPILGFLQGVYNNSKFKKEVSKYDAEALQDAIEALQKDTSIEDKSKQRPIRILQEALKRKQDIQNQVFNTEDISKLEEELKAFKDPAKEAGRIAQALRTYNKFESAEQVTTLRKIIKDSIAMTDIQKAHLNRRITFLSNQGFEPFVAPKKSKRKKQQKSGQGFDKTLVEEESTTKTESDPFDFDAVAKSEGLSFDAIDDTEDNSIFRKLKDIGRVLVGKRKREKRVSDLIMEDKGFFNLFYGGTTTTKTDKSGKVQTKARIGNSLTDTIKQSFVKAVGTATKGDPKKYGTLAKNQEQATRFALTALQFVIDDYKSNRDISNSEGVELIKDFASRQNITREIGKYIQDSYGRTLVSTDKSLTKAEQDLAIVNYHIKIGTIALFLLEDMGYVEGLDNGSGFIENFVEHDIVDQKNGDVLNKDTSKLRGNQVVLLVNDEGVGLPTGNTTSNDIKTQYDEMLKPIMAALNPANLRNPSQFPTKSSVISDGSKLTDVQESWVKSLEDTPMFFDNSFNQVFYDILDGIGDQTLHEYAQSDGNEWVSVMFELKVPGIVHEYQRDKVTGRLISRGSNAEALLAFVKSLRDNKYLSDKERRTLYHQYFSAIQQRLHNDSVAANPQNDKVVSRYIQSTKYTTSGDKVENAILISYLAEVLGIDGDVIVNPQDNDTAKSLERLLQILSNKGIKGLFDPEVAYSEQYKEFFVGGNSVTQTVTALQGVIDVRNALKKDQDWTTAKITTNVYPEFDASTSGLINKMLNFIGTGFSGDKDLPKRLEDRVKALVYRKEDGSYADGYLQLIEKYEATVKGKEDKLIELRKVTFDDTKKQKRHDDNVKTKELELVAIKSVEAFVRSGDKFLRNLAKYPVMTNIYGQGLVSLKRGLGFQVGSDILAGAKAEDPLAIAAIKALSEFTDVTLPIKDGSRTELGNISAGVEETLGKLFATSLKVLNKDIDTAEKTVTSMYRILSEVSKNIESYLPSLRSPFDVTLDALIKLEGKGVEGPPLTKEFNFPLTKEKMIALEDTLRANGVTPTRKQSMPNDISVRVLPLHAIDSAVLLLAYRATVLELQASDTLGDVGVIPIHDAMLSSPAFLKVYRKNYNKAVLDVAEHYDIKNEIALELQSVQAMLEKRSKANPNLSDTDVEGHSVASLIESIQASLKTNFNEKGNKIRLERKQELIEEFRTQLEGSEGGGDKFVVFGRDPKGTLEDKTDTSSFGDYTVKDFDLESQSDKNENTRKEAESNEHDWGVEKKDRVLLPDKDGYDKLNQNNGNNPVIVKKHYENLKALVASGKPYVIIDTETTFDNNQNREVLEIYAITMIGSKKINTHRVLMLPSSQAQYTSDRNHLQVNTASYEELLAQKEDLTGTKEYTYEIDGNTETALTRDVQASHEAMNELFKQIEADFIAEGNTDKPVMVGHNFESFDDTVLRNNSSYYQKQEYQIVDTFLAFTQDLQNNGTNPSEFKKGDRVQSAMAKAYDLEANTSTAHKAQPDVEELGDIVTSFTKEHSTSEDTFDTYDYEFNGGYRKYQSFGTNVYKETSKKEGKKKETKKEQDKKPDPKEEEVVNEPYTVDELNVEEQSILNILVNTDTKQVKTKLQKLSVAINKLINSGKVVDKAYLADLQVLYDYFKTTDIDPSKGGITTTTKGISVSPQVTFKGLVQQVKNHNTLKGESDAVANFRAFVNLGKGPANLDKREKLVRYLLDTLLPFVTLSDSSIKSFSKSFSYVYNADQISSLSDEDVASFLAKGIKTVLSDNIVDVVSDIMGFIEANTPKAAIKFIDKLLVDLESLEKDPELKEYLETVRYFLAKDDLTISSSKKFNFKRPSVDERTVTVTDKNEDNIVNDITSTRDFFKYFTHELNHAQVSVYIGEMWGQNKDIIPTDSRLPTSFKYALAVYKKFLKHHKDGIRINKDGGEVESDFLGQTFEARIKYILDHNNTSPHTGFQEFVAIYRTNSKFREHLSAEVLVENKSVFEKFVKSIADLVKNAVNFFLTPEEDIEAETGINSSTLTTKLLNRSLEDIIVRAEVVNVEANDTEEQSLNAVVSIDEVLSYELSPLQPPLRYTPLTNTFSVLNNLTKGLLDATIIPIGASIFKSDWVQNFHKRNMSASEGMYHTTYEAIKEKWDPSDFTRRMLVYMQLMPGIDYDSLNKYLTINTKAEQERNNVTNAILARVKASYTDVINNYTPEQVAHLESVFNRSFIHLLEDSNEHVDLEAIMTSSDPLTVIDEQIVAVSKDLTNGSTILGSASMIKYGIDRSAKDLAHYYNTRELGDMATSGVSETSIFDALGGRFLEQYLRLTSLYQLKELGVDTIKTLNTFKEDSKSTGVGSYKTLMGLSRHTNLMSDMVDRDSNNTLMFKSDNRTGRKDLYDENYDIRPVTTEEYKALDSTENWVILQKPTDKLIGVVARIRTDFGKVSGIVSASTITDQGKHISSANMLKYKYDVKLNNIETRSYGTNKRHTLRLTQAMLDKLKITKSVPDVLYRAYAHNVEIYRGLSTLGHILDNQTMTVSNVGHLAVLEKGLEKGNKPMFLTVDRKFFTKNKARFPLVNEFYMETKGVTNALNFSSTVTHIHKDLRDQFLGYNKKALSNNKYIRGAEQIWRDLVLNFAVHVAIVNPPKIAMDTVSNTSILLANGVPLRSMLTYGKEAIKLHPEMQKLRNNLILAQMTLGGIEPNTTGYIKQEAVVTNLQEQIKKHPFAVAINAGFLQSLSTSILIGQQDEINAMQKRVKFITDKVIDTAHMRGVLQGMSNFGPSIADLLEYAHSKVKSNSKTNEVGALESELEIMSRKFRSIKDKQALGEWGTEISASASGSELVRLGGGLVTMVDLIAKWVLYNHTVNSLTSFTTSQMLKAYPRLIKYKGTMSLRKMKELIASDHARDSFIDYRARVPEEIGRLKDYGVWMFPEFFLRIQSVIAAMLYNKAASTASMHTAMVAANMEQGSIIKSMMGLRGSAEVSADGNLFYSKAGFESLSFDAIANQTTDTPNGDFFYEKLNDKLKGILTKLYPDIKLEYTLEDIPYRDANGNIMNQESISELDIRTKSGRRTSQTIYEVVSASGEVIASADTSSRRSSTKIHINDIEVSEDARGLGIGSKLVAYIISSNPSMPVTLSAYNMDNTLDTPRTVKWYQTLGFELTDVSYDPEVDLPVNMIRKPSPLFNQSIKGKIKGQANITAQTVLINSLLQSQDTLPHEYAHHYIAMFRDAPIVKMAIKKWGGEEALVQAIGEQVVKQKGEVFGWWKKFTNWVKNLFSKSTIKQNDLDTVKLALTEAFLKNHKLESVKTLSPKMYSSNGLYDKSVNYIIDKVPTLLDTGSKKEYISYLKTIFPTSGVQDLVNHTTFSGETFNQQQIIALNTLSKNGINLDKVNIRSVRIFLSKVPIKVRYKDSTGNVHTLDVTEVSSSTPSNVVKNIINSAYSESWFMKQSFDRKFLGSGDGAAVNGQGFYFSAKNDGSIGYAGLDSTSSSNSIIIAKLNIEHPYLKTIGSSLHSDLVSNPINSIYVSDNFPESVSKVISSGNRVPNDTLLSPRSDTSGVNFDVIRSLKKQFGVDGIIGSEEFVVPEPEQIHVLGSDKDIKMFKEWKARQKTN